MCHICPKTFPNRSALKEHLYSHVAKSEQKQCRDCGKWLKNDSTLRLHMKSHGSQLFRCPHCDKVYNFPQSLRDHLQSHSNIHPHECLVCGKAFKRKQGLKVSTCHHWLFLMYILITVILILFLIFLIALFLVLFFHFFFLFLFSYETNVLQAFTVWYLCEYFTSYYVSSVIIIIVHIYEFWVGILYKRISNENQKIVLYLFNGE
jgi:RNase P subunit RPR2